MENTNRQETAARRPRKRRRNHPLLTFFKIFGTLCVIGVLTVVMFYFIFMQYVHTSLDPILDVDASAYMLKQSSVVYCQDRTTGEWVEYEKLHGSEDRTLVEFSDIPPHVWQALVAIEDERFFEHNGVDWKSTLKGVYTLFAPGEQLRGGSTITQQVIKNLTGSNETTIKRKVTEIFRALRFAEKYSREEVLELYLNLVYFGHGAYGIEAASERYFGKSVSELSVAEGAAIVGITKYPYLYDPSRSGKLDSGKTYRQVNKERQETVLYKMNEQGYLTDAEYQQALDEKLVFVWDEDYVAEEDSGEQTEVASSSLYPYFVEVAINDIVEDMVEKYDYDSRVAKDLLYTGGYQIYLTVDPTVQQLVEEVYADPANLPYTSAKGEQLQSGMTVIDNATGDIIAVAGRIGEREGAFLLNFATNTRPCGSAIKPLSVYAPALESGLITPASVLDDYPVRLLENSEQELKAWPNNSYTGYRGHITLQEAIYRSTNTTAVRTIEELGIAKSYACLTEKLGFTTLVSDDLNSASLALGGLTHGVTTVEMAAAYATFANSGIYTRPRTYVEVRDSNGNVILENKRESSVVFSESTVYQMNELLKNVVRDSSGTGRVAAFDGMTIAGKTGTTSNKYDRYFVGYTPYYTAAVWVGYEHNARIETQSGENPPASLWKKVMQPLHASLPDKEFESNAVDLVEVTVCTRTGLLQGDWCPEVQTVLVGKDTAPVLTCDAHVTLSICAESGCFATEYCPAEQVTTVSVIDTDSPNITDAELFGYQRTPMYVPYNEKELATYLAQREEALSAAAEQAELLGDPTILEAAELAWPAEPQGTLVTTRSGSVQLMSDYVEMGACTLHVPVVEPEPEPTPGEGIDPSWPWFIDENGIMWYIDPEGNFWPATGGTEDPEPEEPEDPENPDAESLINGILDWLTGR